MTKQELIDRLKELGHDDESITEILQFKIDTEKELNCVTEYETYADIPCKQVY